MVNEELLIDLDNYLAAGLKKLVTWKNTYSE